MSVDQLLSLLRLVVPLLSMLEVQEIAALNALVDKVQNPIEKAALKSLIVALDGFEKEQLKKLG